jgi:phage terminase large subunit GpA-like protein
MYAPTSTSLPRSGLTSGQDHGLTDFDGAAEILRTWGAGLTPDPDLTVSEWVDMHRMLSGRASAAPGRYRKAGTPYMPVATCLSRRMARG